MRAAALARVGEAEAVEEVLQNVAVAAIQAARRGTAIDRFGPWLYRVLIRQCLMFRRQRGRQRRLLDQVRVHAAHGVTGEGYIPSDDARQRLANPLEWLLALEQQALVRQALQSLPPRETELLILKYVERWSYQQIATHLGVSVSTVESRLHRARQQLRNRLSSQFPG